MNKGKAKLIYRHSTSFHGFQVDELKSALQKAIRRGQSDTACKAFAEMSNLLSLFPNQTIAKSIRTNAINRVIICALEDVGVANPPLVLYTLENLLPMTWKKKRADFDFESVITCVMRLADSPKSRVTSWLHHAYGVEANRELSAAEGLVWHELEDWEADGLGADGQDTVEVMTEGSEVRFEVTAKDRVEGRAERRGRKARGEMAGGEASTEVEARRRERPLSDPNWFRCRPAGQARLLQRIGEQGRLGRWLALAWQHLSEQRPALSLGLAMAYFGLPQPGLDPVPPATGRTARPTVNGSGTAGVGVEREGAVRPSGEWLAALQTHAYVLVLGAEALDVHTARGRRAGRTGADFRTSGAHVENEAMHFHDQRLARIYANTRKR